MAISRQRFLFNAPSSGTHNLIVDLWQNVSAQERKLHRQFQTCHVRGGLLKDSNQDAVASFNVAPHTWVTKTALRRGKRMFDKMVKEALEGTSGVIKPKYLDYKVYLNSLHENGQYTVLYAKDAEGNNIPRNEWVYSQYTSEDVDWDNTGLTGTSNRDADNFFAHVVGEHSVDAAGTPNENWKSIGLIRSWFDSRAEPDASGQPLLPAGASTDPLVNLFDESDTVDEIIEMLDTYNDRPPYDEDNHFGVSASGNDFQRHLQRVAFAATQAGAGQISAINGFSAICGLVEIQLTTNGSGLVELLLDVETQGEKI